MLKESDIIETSIAIQKMTKDREEVMKYDGEKPRMDLLDPKFLEDVAKVLTFGAKKYAPNRWRKGIEVSRLIAATMRHINAISSGEDNDLETGLPHAAHAACEIMFLNWMLANRKDLDDRYIHDKA